MSKMKTGKCPDNDNDNNHGNQYPVYVPLIYRKRKKKRGGTVIAILGFVVGNSNLRFDVTQAKRVGHIIDLTRHLHKR